MGCVGKQMKTKNIERKASDKLKFVKWEMKIADVFQYSVYQTLIYCRRKNTKKT